MHARGQLWILVVAVGLSFPPPSAAAQWVPDGVALCTTPDLIPDLYPKIVSDRAGGAIVTWMDYRNGANWDIYAQLVNAMGVPPVARTPSFTFTASSRRL